MRERDRSCEREREKCRENMNPAPLSEERDVLDRSKKKLQDVVCEFSGDQLLRPRVERWMLNSEKEGDGEGSLLNEGITGKKWRSFKEAVMNKNSESKEEEEGEEEDWWSDDRWKERVTVNMTNLGPNVIFNQAEKDRLAKNWKNALIVKLLGRMVDPIYFASKIQQLWAKVGEVEPIDVGAGYFVVRFTDGSDYELALTGGPWLLFDHYIAVQPWKQDFDPEGEVVTTIAAWIRFAKLPLDYYDKGALYVLGSQVGRVLKLDANTLKRKKGRFARICVELNLSAPLRPFILINGKVTRIQYEGIHSICFKCGRYGHDVDHCPHRSEDQLPNEKNGEELRKRETEKGVNKENEIGATSGLEKEGDGGVETDKTSASKYDRWMLVQRPRRPRKTENNAGGSDLGRREVRHNNGFNMRGSRFNMLNLESNNCTINESYNSRDTEHLEEVSKHAEIEKGEGKNKGPNIISNQGRAKGQEKTKVNEISKARLERKVYVEKTKGTTQKVNLDKEIEVIAKENLDSMKCDFNTGEQMISMKCDSNIVVIQAGTSGDNKSREDKAEEEENDVELLDASLEADNP